MSSSKSLVVVRGSSDGSLDPTFACMSHSQVRNAYCAIELDEHGSVTDRTLYRGAKELPRLYKKMSEYSSVECDDRSADRLLPLSPPAHATRSNMETYRRAKSDVEIERLTSIASHMQTMLRNAGEKGGGATFRGAMAKERNDVTTAVREATHPSGEFVETHVGAKHVSGLTVELSTVTPRSDAWTARMEQVHRGLDAVQERLYAGAPIDELNQVFLTHVDDETTALYGDCLHQSGYQAWEACNDRSLRQHDVVTLGGSSETASEIRRSCCGACTPSPRPCEEKLLT